MAKLTVGTLTVFNHEHQEWSLYHERLEQWFLANEIGGDADKAGCKRRAILLSNCSESSYKLIRDLALPRQVGTLSYSEVVALLDGHFKPKKCTFAERYKFHSATQHIGEGLPEWAARVRGLAIHCGFVASNLDEQLRDRFVLGMTSGPERDKLFTKAMSELTLSKALEIAEGVHSARMGAKETTLQADGGIPLQVMKMETAARAGAARGSNAQRRSPAAAASAASAERGLHSSSGGGCTACGYAGHEASTCRFVRYKCKKCGVQGHLKRMCKQTVNKQHYVECCGDVGDDGKHLCCNIRTFCGEPMRESVCVNGINLTFEIDTGSPVTVISEQMFLNHFANTSLETSDVILHSYNGDKLHIIGKINLSFTYNNKSCTISVYVVRNGGPPLLGRDFFSRFDLQICSLNNCSDFLSVSSSKYPQLFGSKLGCLKGVKVDLALKPDSKPIFFKARPLPFALRESVEKELNRLVGLGVLVPVKYAEYASPIVPVLKRDGSIRLCADYSVTINKQLLVDKYPLPRYDELFAKLHGGRYFSKLDLSHAYNQLCLNEKAQMLTCINTHKGLFKFTRLVFGLASAPAIFQRSMEALLSGLEGTLLFLDDILVCGVDREQMMIRLNEVFHRLQEAGLVLNIEKCSFFQESVSYLGFVIDRNGIHKSPEKIKAILQSRIPTNTSELKSFLGMVNYYRNFIRNASSILSPLHKLLQKHVPWSWTKEHDKAVSTIKRELVSDTTLAHFNPEALLIVTVDASPCGLGAVLSQIEGGVEKPISYISRSLNAAEKRYSQIQKEATAIIFGIRKFHQYLYGRTKPFILRTDHKPLVSIFNPEKGIPEISANRLQRYAIFLSAYNYKIEYVSSVHNCADYLSRAVTDDSKTTITHLQRDESFLVDKSSYVRFVYEGERFLSLSDIREAIKLDNVMSTVIDFTLNGWPSQINEPIFKDYYSHRCELSVENGCLMRGHKLVIPRSLQYKVLNELHSGHLGITKVKEEARIRFWWPGMSVAIEHHIGACAVCASQRATPPRTPLTPWPFPAQPWHRVHLDFLGPIYGKTFLIIVDAYSKWVECFDVSSGFTSRIVIEKLCEVMSRFGLFHTICSDNGASFVSHEFKQFCARNNIMHLTSPAYNPASNGQAESYVKIIKKAIKSFLLSGSCLRDLNIKIQEFLLSYRNSKHTTTNRSPAEVLFGRKLRCRLDLLTPAITTPSDVSLDSVVKVKQCSQINNYRGNRKVSFSEQEQVLVKLYKQNKHYWAHGVIIRIIGKTMYLVQLSESRQTVKRHANQLLKYRGREDEPREEVVPAFIMPSHPIGSEQQPSKVSEEPAVAYESPTPGLVDGEHTAKKGVNSTAPSIEPEPEGRSKRKRTVVDYKQFF